MKAQCSTLLKLVLILLLGSASCVLAQDDDLSQRIVDLEQRLSELEKQQTTVSTNSDGGRGGNGCAPTWAAEVDFLSWTLRSMRPEYGITDIGGVQDRGPVGSILTIDTESDNGIRLGIHGHPFADGDRGPRVSLQYASFDSQASASYAGSLRATFISSDNSENNDSDDMINDITPDDRATQATASLDFEYEVIDLTIGKTMPMSDDFDLELYGGLRCMEMDHDFHVTYSGGDFQSPLSPYELCSIEGIGLLMGTDLSWDIPAGWGVNLGCKGGMILGDVETQTYIPDDEPGVPTNVTYNETRSVPFVELAASLSYTKQLGDYLVNARLGYEMINWFDVIDSRVFTDSHIEGQNVHQAGDLSLDGLFLRIGIGF